MMLPLACVVGLHIKAVSVGQCQQATASGVDNAASRRRTHRWTGLFHPQKRLITMQKQLEGRSILMSSADRVAHIDGALSNYCEQYTRASRLEYKYLSNKTRQSIYECLLEVLFLPFFCAATNFGCIDSFFCPIPETKMMGDGFAGAYCRFVLNSKRLLSTSCCVKQGQRSSE